MLERATAVPSYIGQNSERRLDSEEFFIALKMMNQPPEDAKVHKVPLRPPFVNFEKASDRVEGSGGAVNRHLKCFSVAALTIKSQMNGVKIIVVATRGNKIHGGGGERGGHLPRPS